MNTPIIFERCTQKPPLNTAGVIALHSYDGGPFSDIAIRHLLEGPYQLVQKELDADSLKIADFGKLPTS